MKLSSKQIALRDYLLQRLGFENDQFLKIFIEKLSQIADVYRHLSIIPNSKWDINNPLPYFTHQIYDENLDELKDGGIWVPHYFGIVDLLMWEYKFKRGLAFKKKEHTSSSYLTATDLANFIFCPVGYSISKSYEQITNSHAFIGTEMHEQKLLDIEKRRIFEDKKSRELEESERKAPTYLNPSNQHFFNDIAKSDLIYSGHTKDEDKKYFVNKDKEFVGQPDYIFKNKQGRFYVVEEKFKLLQEGKQNYFADSHRVQLATYIHYLRDYNIEYGYLVYWIYKRSTEGYRWLDNCLILKINRETKIEVFLDSLLHKIKDFTQKKSLVIDTEKLNPAKCASCVHMIICGHKTKRHKQVTLPYQQDYFSLYSAPYPEILKKKDDPNQT